MYLGPIHALLPGLSSGFNPVKAIKVTSTTGKQTVLFDQEYTYPLQSQPVTVDAPSVVYESTPQNAAARMTQILELAQNAEWQRCGLYVQWREDGAADQEDGWYVYKTQDFAEDLLFSSYAEPTISLELRARVKSSVGVFVDSKALPNDANLGGVGLAALPAGFITQYPAATWTFVGANGNISVIENPTSVVRATLSLPINTMTMARCIVTDEA
jgi:hypothetical protein